MHQIITVKVTMMIRLYTVAFIMIRLGSVAVLSTEPLDIVLTAVLSLQLMMMHIPCVPAMDTDCVL